MTPAYITLTTAIIAIALWLISTYGEPFILWLVDRMVAGWFYDKENL